MNRFEVNDKVVVSIDDDVVYGPARVQNVISRELSYYYQVSDGQTTYIVAEYEIELDEDYKKEKTVKEAVKQWTAIKKDNNK
jgi:hypothetical protein